MSYCEKCKSYNFRNDGNCICKKFFIRMKGEEDWYSLHSLDAESAAVQYGETYFYDYDEGDPANIDYKVEVKDHGTFDVRAEASINFYADECDEEDEIESEYPDLYTKD